MMGKLMRLELPEVESMLLQGNACVRIYNDEEDTHTVLAPLSGRVVEVNQQLSGNLTLLDSDPFNDGWLFRITPTQPYLELDNLTKCTDY